MDEITIKEYVDQRFADERTYNDRRFDDQDAAVKSALAASDKQNASTAASAEKAVDKAEGQSEKWRDNANEWRGAMSDRERDFLSRKEFYAIVGTAVAVIILAITLLAILRPAVSK
jgi:hypothetical protein